MDGESLDEMVVDVDEVVRQRALLVRDALALGPVRAAEAHGVSRQTVSTWLARYRSGGPATLRRGVDRRRAREEVREAVLTAPLWMPTTKWSSRSVAEALGVSQSLVARTWGAGTENSAEILGPDAHEHDLVALLVAPDHVVLVLRRTSRPAGTGRSADPRVLRAWRTVLAADLLRDRVTEPEPSTFWPVVTAAGPGLLVVTSREAAVPAVAPVLGCADAGAWLSLAPTLAARVPGPSVVDLQDALRRWSPDPRTAFTWTGPSRSPEVPSGRRRAARRPGARHGGAERALADDIVATIRDDVMGGRLTGGDRVTERHLAGRLRTTRARVRGAVELLEHDGLLTVTDGRAAVVAVPGRGDVVETYAARRALGALVVRAAIRSTPPARRAVTAALATVEERAATGDVAGCSRADIDFQDALAEASGLARIGPMLTLLADQLRMFIAVMGIDYAFPVDAIVALDRAILAAVEEGDADLAVRQWQAKVDQALAYMLRQL